MTFSPTTSSRTMTRQRSTLRRFIRRPWQACEEDFDTLGQVLEHYSFLQERTAKRSTDGDASLLCFDVLAEGTV